MIERRGFLVAMLALGACATSGLPPPAGPSARHIALTFDDVPRTRGPLFMPDERAVRIIAGLKRAGVEQAAFFLNPGHLDTPDGAGGRERIAAYVAAGHVIANHSNTHPHLSEVTADTFLADIDQAERWLAGRPGRRPWFRFPYLDEGGRDKVKRDTVRAGLAERGLRNGYVTVDASDWLMEQNVADAIAAGKSVAMTELRDLYVNSHVEAAEVYDTLAVRALGCSPAHVLVLHETDLAALFLHDLVSGLRAKGWTIVTADEAYADPLREAMPDLPYAGGPLIEALAWQAKLPAPRWYEGNRKDVANRRFASEVLHEVAP